MMPSSKKCLVYTETLEITENDVIPLPGLVWCRKFTSLKVKGEEKQEEEYPVHTRFTAAVSCSANINFNSFLFA